MKEKGILGMLALAIMHDQGTGRDRSHRIIGWLDRKKNVAKSDASRRTPSSVETIEFTANGREVKLAAFLSSWKLG